MKSFGEILKDIGKFFIRAIQANLGLSGEKWEVDGAAPRFWIEAIVLDVLIIPMLILVVKPTIELETISAIVMLGAVWSFFGIGVIIPLLLEYLEVRFPVEGLTQEEAKEMYGREMKIQPNLVKVHERLKNS